MKKVKRIPKQPDRQCTILDQVYGSWSLGNLDETKGERAVRQTSSYRSQSSLSVLDERVQKQKAVQKRKDDSISPHIS